MDHWVSAASQNEKFESAPSGLCFHDGFTMLAILNLISEVSGAAEINIQSHHFELGRRAPQFSKDFSAARSRRTGVA